MKRLAPLLFFSMYVLSACGGGSALKDGAAPQGDLRAVAEKLSAAGERLPNRRVAIVAFSSVDGKVSLEGDVVAERLIYEVVELGALTVVERARLNKLAEEQKLNLSGALDEDTASQVGELLGVDALVTGTVAELKGEIEVLARMVKVESGEIVAVARCRQASTTQRLAEAEAQQAVRELGQDPGMEVSGRQLEGGGDAPVISAVRVIPRQPTAGKPLVFEARVNDPQGVKDLRGVALAGLDNKGRSVLGELRDDGRAGDRAKGDGVYTLVLPPLKPEALKKIALAGGALRLAVVAADKDGHKSAYALEISLGQDKLDRKDIIKRRRRR